MEAKDFVDEIVINDKAKRVYSRPIATRFPPEPGGCLHIGHAKAIFANYRIAQDHGGLFSLRMDDTDPFKDYAQFIDVVIADVRSLGIDPGERIYFASDYFQKIFDYTLRLIKEGHAFVCDLTEEQLRDYRGDFFKAGRPSPFRDRSPDENLDLFLRMQAGEFEAGSRCLRAKIDINSPNILLRDPVLYRLLKKPHYRQNDRWNVYPMYDYAHPMSDFIEGITHSLCGKEFEVHNELYHWPLKTLNLPEAPKQIEFAELRMTHTVIGKRHVRKMIQNKQVESWDDPRLLTLQGMWRRGYTAGVLRTFFDRMPLSKSHSLIGFSQLEDCCREYFNPIAPRALAVLRPIKLVIENLPEGHVEWVDAENNPTDSQAGSRRIPFTRELYIEQEDFLADPPKGYFRLAPDREVRLKYAYFVKCTGFVTDAATGAVTEIRATYDPETKGGKAPDGRKVKGTIHWVSASESIAAEVRLFDRLTHVEDTSELADKEDISADLNPNSIQVLDNARLEPALGSAVAGQVFQFERMGYFCPDKESKPGKLIFNRTVTLRDSYTKNAP